VIEVSQLSLKCNHGFLLSLLSKKSKKFFLQKNFLVIFKNLYFEFDVEIEKMTLLEFLFVSGNFFKKFEQISKFNLGGDRFFDKNCRKTVVYYIFKKK
jgi:hypothetical protein